MGNDCCTKKSIITKNENAHEDNAKILNYEDEYYLNYYINFKTLKKYIDISEKVNISAYLINAKSIPNFRDYIFALENKNSNDIQIKKTDLEKELINIQICDNYEKCLTNTEDKDNEFLIITENLVNNEEAQKVKINKDERNLEIVFNTQQTMKFEIKPVFLCLKNEDVNFNPRTEYRNN